jgi:type IV pilus assembly protein PilM
VVNVLNNLGNIPALSSLTKLLGKQGKGLGIELAPDRMNIVQLKKQRQGIKLESLITVPVPEGIIVDGQINDAPRMAELLQETMAENKIKTTRAATCIPGRDAIVRVIPVPAELDNKELREMVLNHEAALYLPYPREEADVDYQKLGYFVDEDGIEKVQVLLVATRKEVTDTYINTFAEAGIGIDVLEINSFALIRTIRDQLRLFGPQEAAVLVDIEFDSTEIAIIINGVPQFSRTVPIGTYQLQAALSRAMNLPASRDMDMLMDMEIPAHPLDAARTGMTGANPGMGPMLKILGELADELRRSIDFYINQSEGLEVAQILLAGMGGGLQQLDEFFTQRLGFPTTQIDPIRDLSLQVDPDKYPPVKRPGLGIVLGLGMREA